MAHAQGTYPPSQVFGDSGGDSAGRLLLATPPGAHNDGAAYGGDAAFNADNAPASKVGGTRPKRMQIKVSTTREISDCRLEALLAGCISTTGDWQ